MSHKKVALFLGLTGALICAYSAKAGEPPTNLDISNSLSSRSDQTESSSNSFLSLKHDRDRLDVGKQAFDEYQLSLEGRIGNGNQVTGKVRYHAFEPMMLGVGKIGSMNTYAGYDIDASYDSLASSLGENRDIVNFGVGAGVFQQKGDSFFKVGGIIRYSPWSGSRMQALNMRYNLRGKVDLKAETGRQAADHQDLSIRYTQAALRYLTDSKAKGYRAGLEVGVSDRHSKPTSDLAPVAPRNDHTYTMGIVFTNSVRGAN